MNNKTNWVKYTIKGHVQGIGYRNYTQKKARKLEIVGFVRNVESESLEKQVEVVAIYKNQEQKSLFEMFLKRGPMLAKVREVKEVAETKNSVSLGEESDFIIQC